jgi:hypothetical protein
MTVHASSKCLTQVGALLDFVSMQCSNHYRIIVSHYMHRSNLIILQSRNKPHYKLQCFCIILVLGVDANNVSFNALFYVFRIRVCGVAVARTLSPPGWGSEIRGCGGGGGAGGDLNIVESCLASLVCPRIFNITFLVFVNIASKLAYILFKNAHKFISIHRFSLHAVLYG